MRHRPFSSHTRPTAYTRLSELRLPCRNAPRRFNSSKPNSSQRAGPSSTSSGSSHEQPLSFSQRMRKLSREYGWSALGVYLLLSALDFPFCFAAVRLLGVDRIGHWEHTILESAKRVLDSVLPLALTSRKEEAQAEGEDSTAAPARETGTQDSRKTASEEASKSHFRLSFLTGFHIHEAVSTCADCSACQRYLDPSRPRLRSSQESHLLPRAVDSSHHAQCRQDPPSLGVGYWETQTEGRITGYTTISIHRPSTLLQYN